MPQFPSNIDLSSLNGANGFSLSGVAENDLAGVSAAAAGDVNGDGLDDIIVGAWRAGPDNRGESYVVFGRTGGFAANIDLSSLDGTTGFTLSGAPGEGIGWSVASAGDVNGDGFADLIVGAPDSPGSDAGSGAGYVVFGKAGGFASDIDLSGLDGTAGFKLSGAAAGHGTARSVASAGDVNGDGFADLIVGSTFGNASYVVFGKAGGFDASVDLAGLDGSTGFRLEGDPGNGASGWSVASAGDVNGDGFADLIVGDRNGNGTSVVFGKAGGFASNVELTGLDGSTGFRLSGEIGISVASAGDVNGDGFADVIVGAPYAGPNGFWSGASYVVFGKAGGFASNVNLSSLDGSTGFKLSGVGAGDRSGHSVASAGDVNGDGFDDMIVGAFGGPNDSYTGESYVVFGKAGGFAANMDLSGLDGSNGFRVSGVAAGDYAGWSVDSAGDVNGDGFADLILGAFAADPNGDHSGASYVVFGRAPDTPVVRNGTGASQTLAGGGFGDVLIGQGGDDRLYGNGGSDTLLGGDGDDALHGGASRDNMSGGAGDDTYYVDNSGDVTTEFANEGTDTVHTTVSYTLVQNVERLIADSDAGLTLTGNSRANSITGGGGNDTLNGGGGADAMNGGAGNDRYRVDNDGDRVTDSSGLDSIYTTIDYALDAGLERLYARSDAGLVLGGNGGNNMIVGRGGDDTITGGGGRDVMTGGGGADHFAFGALSDSVVGGGRDLIRDFQTGSDKIDLEGIDANSALADDQAFSFIGSAAFSHTAGELQAKAFGANTLVSGDVDGNGTADFQVLLSGSVVLQATDFML